MMLEETVPDKNLELAYDAALQALSQQDVSLGNLRNRATGLLSAAALVTSFAAGLGLLNTDPEKGEVFPVWAGVTLLCILIVIGALTMKILWPVNYHHGADAKQLMEQKRQGRSEDDVREYMVERLM